MRAVVLNDDQPFTPLLIEPAQGETQLFAKEVVADGKRSIVCRTEAEAAKDATDRAAIVAALDQQLKKGDKALIGNSAYRRYLRRVRRQGGETAGPAFEIDAGKLADEARYDGIFVLRTNARIMPLQAVLGYRDLLQIEELFRTAKALLHTRPIFHSSDAAIRGHVFCSFLALVLRKELQDRCAEAGFTPGWTDMLRDLDRLQEVVIDKDGKDWRLRTEATGAVPPLFKALRLALPAKIQTLSATGPPTPCAPAAKPIKRRQGRPRRGVTLP